MFADLAQKVESALPSEVCAAALAPFKMAYKLTASQQPDLSLSLKLLHREDLAAGRVHEIHGLSFINSGRLFSLRKLGARGMTQREYLC